ncbi:hypothetical protein [Dactylosporangium sp. NPDC005555]|uniref:hypothetical protein n=1 Tax=Dactylosporangium sp. NPDC005555 TaxID=3154889 RepID=UPI0033A1EF2E
MRRLLWLGIGLAIGALVVRAVAKKAQAFTPQGIAAQARDSAAGLAGTVRGFVDDVRDGMAEREAEIHAAFTDGSTLDEDLYPEGRQHR